MTAFVYARGKSRAECSCGYDGRRRFTRASAILDAGQHAARTGCQLDWPLVVDERAVGVSWFQRLTPWPVLAWSPLLLIAGVWFAPPADALMLQPQRITVAVVWTGAPDCVQMWVPAGGDQVRPLAACSTQHMWSTSYPAPRPGVLVGVDPVMSGAETMSCSVSAIGGSTVTDFGVRGDGDDVSCLSRWAA